jgi:hypothetical protein
LGEIREPAVPGLTDTLKDKDPGVRVKAINALHCMREGRLTNVFQLALQDPNERVIQAAAGALESLDYQPPPELAARFFTATKNGYQVSQLGPKAVEELLRGLRSDDPSNRCWAADLLGSIGDTRAVLPLTAALTDHEPSARRPVQHSRRDCFHLRPNKPTQTNAPMPAMGLGMFVLRVLSGTVWIRVTTASVLPIVLDSLGCWLTGSPMMPGDVINHQP